VTEEDSGEGSLARLRAGFGPLLLYALVALASFPTLGLIAEGRNALAYAHDLFDIPRSGVPGDWQEYGLTLWNSHVGAGNALLAQQAIGPFAIDVPLSMLVGPFPAFVIGCWLLSFVAGFSMHLFLRDSLGLVTPAVVFGAIVFALGFWHPVIGFPVPAFPLLLWVLDHVVRPSRRRWAAVVGHVLLGAFVLYNGQAQIVVILAALELAWLTWVRRDWGRWRVMVASLVGMWALSFMLYAPVVLTQLVALPDSQRAIWEIPQLKPLQAIRQGLHRYSQVLIGVPLGRWGSSLSIYGTFFLGVVGLPLAIAALGALRPPRDRTRLFVLALLVVIPVLDVLFELLWPTQAQFGFLRSFQLVRIRHVFVMALAATAAIGLDQVLRGTFARRGPGQPEPWSWIRRWVPVAAVAVAIGAGLVIAYGVVGHRHAIRSLTVPGIGWSLAAMAVVLGAGAFVMLWLAGRRPRWLPVAPVILLVVAGGLVIGERAAYAYAERYLGGQLATWHDALDTTPAQAFVLAQPGSDSDRILSFGEDANRMGAVGLLQADGYQTIYPLAYHTLFGELIRPELDTNPPRARYFDHWGNRAIAFGPRINAAIARLLGVRWLYARRPPPPTYDRSLYPHLPWVPTVDGLVERFADDDATVYEVPDLVPRAFVAGGVSVEADAAAVAEAIAVATTDELRSRAWFEAGPVAEAMQRAVGPSPPAGPAGTARIETYTPDRVVVATSGDRPGLLVLTDLWAPGWVADVDGAAVDVERVDGALRAVPVAAGSHVVTFLYRPWFTYAGFAVAGLGVVMLVIVGFAVRSRDRRVAGRSPVDVGLPRTR
jgi:hypothetical protein